METNERTKNILKLAFCPQKNEESKHKIRKNVLPIFNNECVKDSQIKNSCADTTQGKKSVILEQEKIKDTAEEKENLFSECIIQHTISDFYDDSYLKANNEIISNSVVSQFETGNINITFQEDCNNTCMPSTVDRVDQVFVEAMSDQTIKTADDPIYEELLPFNPNNDEYFQASHKPTNTEQTKLYQNENIALASTSDNKRLRSGCKHKIVSYLDYLSDDEAFVAEAFGYDEGSSSLYEESSSEGSETENTQRNKKKMKIAKIKQKPMTNKEKENTVGELGTIIKKTNKRKLKKETKQSGKEYVKSDGTVVPAKKLNSNPCTGKKCGNNCVDISEERRKQIFDHFWSLDVMRRKDWIVGITQKLLVKRKRATDSEKRQFTYKYFINEGEGKRSICLQFLCNTLDVTQKYIYYTVSNASFGSSKEDLRGKSIPPNKTKDCTKLAVINFIKSLPAVPSHYCRKDSSRVYLSQDFKNLAKLYQIYKKKHIEQGIDVVGERIFRNIFQENFNIGFHVPKKDKCLQCIRFERLDMDTADEDIKKAKLDHVEEKNHSYNRFKMHQNIHKTDPATLCVSFDLQKVLNTPNGESMLLYYSRKISVFNLTFYESGSREVFCFYWDEVNGKRGANEIATILHRYISIVDKRESVKNLLLYCDCCPGQNRNKTILSMIHATLQNCKFIETIQINFLLTGHTYMPVDSVHAIIERSIKNSIIWAPSQWYTVFATARQDPRPYNVEYLCFKDFNKWDVLGEKYFKGNLIGKISKVRVCTFKKKDAHKITIKNSMNDKASSFEIEVQTKVKSAPTSCYKSLLPISKQKYDDLNKLCTNNVIPPIFHHEFINIPTGTVKDTLPDSDIEDDVE